MGGLALLPFVLPLATAVSALIWMKPTGARRQGVALSCLAQVAGSAWLLWVTFHGETLVAGLGGWSAPYGICLVADLTAALMTFMTAVVALGSVLYGYCESSRSEEHPLRLPMIQFMVAGIQLAFLTGDLFNLYVAFELLLIASFVLIALETRPGDLYQCIPYVVLNLAGGALFLCGAALVYAFFGTLNLADLGQKLSVGVWQPATLLVGFVFLVVFGLKAALFPLYFWLPESYPVMSPSLAALFSALLSKVGIYALLRFVTLVLPPGLPFVQSSLLVLSTATMILGVLGAVASTRVKGILAYHSISQVGYMVLAISYLSPLSLAGALYFMVHHAFVKASLFLSGGAASYFFQTDRLPRMGGLYYSHPGLAALFLVSALSLAGVPPFSGFWAKYLVIMPGITQGFYGSVAAAVLTGVLTLVSMLKIWNQVFWHPATKEWKHQVDWAWKRRLWVVGLVVGFMLFMGLGAELWLEICQRAAAQLLDRPAYFQAVLGAMGRGT